MTTLQIVLLSIAGAFALASIVFMIMFIVEISVEHKEKEEQEEVKSVFSTENYVSENKEENVDDMLAKLDEETKDEPAAEEKTEEVAEEPVTEEVQEVVEEPVTEEVQEIVEEPVVEEAVVQEAQEEKPAVNIIINNFANGDSKEETKEETKEESVENLAELDENDDEDETEDGDDDLELMSNINELKNEKHEAITASSVIDYKARLEKIIETRNKIERDLSKIQKSILKYERTKRRKNRNQKMLDRRAGELTNLNLVMYSVTDIKNVDEDKKVKQEELTAHIAELKASIQDAEEFIESNKEKNDHNVKMAKFLLQEKSRYNEEIAELEALIKATEDTSVSA